MKQEKSERRSCGSKLVAFEDLQSETFRELHVYQLIFSCKQQKNFLTKTDGSYWKDVEYLTELKGKLSSQASEST